MSGLQSVSGCLGARNLAKSEREKNDYYASSPEAAEWLCKIEKLNHYIWECACGEGHLSKVFEANGHEVLSTDLIDRGYGIGGVDFLKEDKVFCGDIVTNPPFIHAQEFIEHAMELVLPGNKVCMFMKIQYLEGRKRRKLFDKFPPKTVWISSGRIRCGKNGVFADNMMAFGWYVWEKGYSGETVLKWFN